MKFIDQINDACATHDILDILGADKHKMSLLCPLPQHIAHKGRRTPSFSIFFKDGKQYWKCHGSCNLVGDVIDLIGFMRVSGYSRKDKVKVSEALSLINDRYERTSIDIPPKDTGLSGDEWSQFIPVKQEVLEYALKRGLTQGTLERFKVGQKGSFMSIPTFHEDVLMGIKFRNTSTGMRFYSMKGSLQGLFNYNEVWLTTKPVLILKGEIPAMLAWQNGFTACAPTGGEGSWRSIDNWKVALALARKVVVGDNDDVGRTLGERRAAFFAAKLCFPPPRFKDWDEAWLADASFMRTLTESWLEE